MLILRVMLALALYAFLALVLWMLWQDMKHAGLGVGGRELPSISLRIYTKKPRALYRRFSQTEVTVGRDPACDIRLSDKSISAQHARLIFQRGRWWLEDLNSTSGTRLNHKEAIGRTALGVGDEIKCGQVRVAIGTTSPPVQSAISGVDS